MADSQALGALVLGALVGAGGLFAVQTFVLGAPEDCGGICSDGTICEAGRCELAPLDEPEEPEVAEADGDDGKRKRRRRRGAGDDGGGEGEGEVLADGGPPIDDDSHVPRFNPDADQSISMSDGSGRLSDGQIDAELAKLDRPFQACVRDASQRVTDLGTGTVKYGFGIDGRGKVTGVNVTAPANLKDAGIVPCVRKAVYGHRFPAFDGPTMKVNSSFSVD